MREYVANVMTRRGAWQTVTVWASSAQNAYTRLERMGYCRITNIS